MLSKKPGPSAHWVGCTQHCSDASRRGEERTLPPTCRQGSRRQLLLRRKTNRHPVLRGHGPSESRCKSNGCPRFKLREKPRGSSTTAGRASPSATVRLRRTAAGSNRTAESTRHRLREVRWAGRRGGRRGNSALTAHAAVQGFGATLEELVHPCSTRSGHSELPTARAMVRCVHVRLAPQRTLSAIGVCRSSFIIAAAGLRPLLAAPTVAAES